jgi:sugar-specific transcriptional regulator TrmB
MKQGLLASLSDLGLSQYESKVYTSLIRSKVMTAKEISDVCGIPYGKVYETLSSLAKKGFISILPTRPMKYKVVSPDKVIELVRKDKVDAINRIGILLKKEFGSKWKEHNQNEYLILNGRRAVFAKAKEMMLSSKKNIIVYTSNDGLEKLKEMKDMFDTLNRKKVKVNIIVSSDEAVSDIHFVIVDGREALFFEVNYDTEFGCVVDFGVWTNANSFVKLLEFFTRMVKSNE